MRESVIYRDIIERGEQRGEQKLALLQLNRKLGGIDESFGERVRSLSTEQLEALAEALLDFSTAEDLANWARYKHQQRAMLHPQRFAIANSAKAKKSDNPLISDLIWGEKSPALLAIAINLVITAAIWLPWIFLSRQEASLKAQYAIGLIMTLSLILIYAAIAQITLLRKTQKRALWAVIILGSLLLLLPMAFFIVSKNPHISPFLWLFSPLAFAAVEYASVTTIFVSFLAHLSILGLLSWQLTRKLKKAGESASKSLIGS